jgi:transposase InsO family protein
MKIYSFIAAEKTNFPITFMCRHFDVSTSSYYDWCNSAETRARKAEEEAQLIREMRKVHDESGGTYGSPRMEPALRDLGYCVNHKRVETLMQEHGIVGYTPRRKIRTTIPASDVETMPDLVKRDFDKPAPDVGWCGDITYIPTGEGWLYLATVIDLGSRRVLGFSMEDHMRTSLVEAALHSAVGTRGAETMNDVIFHSDRGSQYTSADFEATCEKLGVTRSVGRTGVCWDNAVAESFFATLKKEFVSRRKFATREQARVAIFGYIETWYNARRLHSTIGYMAPVKWEQQHLLAS